MLLELVSSLYNIEHSLQYYFDCIFSQKILDEQYLAQSIILDARGKFIKLSEHSVILTCKEGH